MEELHIQSSSDLPNNTLIFRFEFRFGYNIEVQPNDPLDAYYNSLSPLYILLYLQDNYAPSTNKYRKKTKREYKQGNIIPSPGSVPLSSDLSNAPSQIWLDGSRDHQLCIFKMLIAQSRTGRIDFYH